MIQNYFKIALRNLWRNRIYVLINVFGMGIAISCCVVAYLNFEFYALHDSQHKRIDEIYRLNFIRQNNDRLQHFGTVPVPVSQLLADIGDVNEISRFIQRRGAIKSLDKLFDTRVAFVDTNFNRLFTIPLLYGNYESIQQRNVIFISKKLSLKCFGKENSIGGVISFLDQGKTIDLVIGGVFASLPLNSSFQFEAMVNIESHLASQQIDEQDWANFATVFFTVNAPENVKAIQNLVEGFTAQHNLFNQNELVIDYYVDPLLGMAERAFENDVAGPFREIIPRYMVMVVSILALLILIIASFTFTNTAIASSARRLKEIGIRKVVGGTKRQIIWQFFGENLVICCLSLVVAIPLTKFLGNEFGKLFPKPIVELSLSDHLGFSVFLVGILGLAGLLAGAYPALYISRFDPAKILKGSLKFGKVSRLSKSLLFVQICFSMFTIIASFLFTSNAAYQSQVDLGFDTEQTVVVRFTEGKSRYKEMKNRLIQHPKILSITGSADHVGRRNYYSTVAYAGEKITIAGMDVGADYIQTMELQLVNGRDFDEKLQSDYEEAVVVNEKFVTLMNWDQPIGKHLVFEDSINYYIVGVVKDFYYDAFNSKIQPMCMRFIRPQDYRYLVAKADAVNVPQLEEELKVLWAELFQSQRFDIKTGKHARFEADFTNLFILKIFIFMGTIATVLSLIGLYALVSLNIEGRMKEMGIRKIMGASGGLIMRQLNRSYSYILILGASFGSTLGYLLIPKLMKAIWANHVNPNLTMIILAIGALMILGVLTVGMKVYVAAMANPVNLLRDE